MELVMLRLIIFACLALAAVLVVSTELSEGDPFGPPSPPLDFGNQPKIEKAV
jgi:hypothetical protein